MYAIKNVDKAGRDAINALTPEGRLAVALLSAVGFSETANEVKRNTWRLATDIALTIEAETPEGDNRLAVMLAALTAHFGDVKAQIKAQAAEKHVRDMRLTLAMPTVVAVGKDRKLKERDTLETIQNKAVKTLDGYDATIRDAWNVLGALPCDSVTEASGTIRVAVARGKIIDAVKAKQSEGAARSTDSIVDSLAAKFAGNIKPYATTLNLDDAQLAGMFNALEVFSLVLGNIAANGGAVPVKFDDWADLFTAEAAEIVRIGKEREVATAETGPEAAAKLLEDSMRDEETGAALAATA